MFRQHGFRIRGKRLGDLLHCPSLQAHLLPTHPQQLHQHHPASHSQTHQVHGQQPGHGVCDPAGGPLSLCAAAVQRGGHLQQCHSDTRVLLFSDMLAHLRNFLFMLPDECLSFPFQTYNICVTSSNIFPICATDF